MDRVLVVDDHVANCVPLARLLRYHQVEARCANSGPEALDVLAGASAAGERFDVVLLDIMMPEMDGFAVLAAIRADRRLDGTAVLMYSAVTDPADHARAAGMGAQGFLVKGTWFDEMLAAMRPFLPGAGGG